METTYINDFDTFLRCTNEKDVLVREVTHELKQYKCDSLLDVGAGNGLMAIPLSQRVSVYTAVEPKETYVAFLRKAGLHVIHSTFPVAIQEMYDAVLFSHVFSYIHPNHEELITSAWDRIRPGGVLLVITYRGEEDDLTKLVRSLNIGNSQEYSEIFENMVQFLSSLGTTVTRKVITTVKTKTVKEMIQALSFVAGNGIPERKENFLVHEKYLSTYLEKYKVDDEYVFPFQHFIITTQKI